MKKYIPFLLMLIIILSACTSQADSLTGTWKLISYGPTESMTTAVPNADATMTFADDGTVSGSSGCNSLSGEYSVDGDQVTFNALTSTLMACDDVHMDQESVVFQVLTGTAQYEVAEDTLTITNGNMILVLASIPDEP